MVIIPFLALLFSPRFIIIPLPFPLPPVLTHVNVYHSFAQIINKIHFFINSSHELLHEREVYGFFFPLLHLSTFFLLFVLILSFLFFPFLLFPFVCCPQLIKSVRIATLSWHETRMFRKLHPNPFCFFPYDVYVKTFRLLFKLIFINNRNKCPQARNCCFYW